MLIGGSRRNLAAIFIIGQVWGIYMKKYCDLILFNQKIG